MKIPPGGSMDESVDVAAWSIEPLLTSGGSSSRRGACEPVGETSKLVDPAFWARLSREDKRLEPILKPAGPRKVEPKVVRRNVA